MLGEACRYICRMPQRLQLVVKLKRNQVLIQSREDTTHVQINDACVRHLVATNRACVLAWLPIYMCYLDYIIANQDIYFFCLCSHASISAGLFVCSARMIGYKSIFSIYQSISGCLSNICEVMG